MKAITACSIDPTETYLVVAGTEVPFFGLINLATGDISKLFNMYSTLGAGGVMNTDSFIQFNDEIYYINGHFYGALQNIEVGSVDLLCFFKADTSLTTLSPVSYIFCSSPADSPIYDYQFLYFSSTVGEILLLKWIYDEAPSANILNSLSCRDFATGN
jgi:hypothetical protein